MADFLSFFILREAAFVTLCFTFRHTKPILKCDLFQKEKFAPKGSKFFPFRADPFSNRQNNFDTVVVPLKMYSFPLM